MGSDKKQYDDDWIIISPLVSHLMMMMMIVLRDDHLCHLEFYLSQLICCIYLLRFVICLEIIIIFTYTHTHSHKHTNIHSVIGCERYETEIIAEKIRLIRMENSK